MLFPYIYVAILQPYFQTECLGASKDAPRPFIWILTHRLITGPSRRKYTRRIRRRYECEGGG